MLDIIFLSGYLFIIFHIEGKNYSFSHIVYPVWELFYLSDSVFDYNYLFLHVQYASVPYYPYQEKTGGD